MWLSHQQAAAAAVAALARAGALTQRLSPRAVGTGGYCPSHLDFDSSTVSETPKKGQQALHVYKGQ